MEIKRQIFLPLKPEDVASLNSVISPSVSTIDQLTRIRTWEKYFWTKKIVGNNVQSTDEGLFETVETLIDTIIGTVSQGNAEAAREFLELLALKLKEENLSLPTD